MTPEQFRDCRTALRALRRAVKGLPPDDEMFIRSAIEDVSHTIWAAMDFLPEFEAMVGAKRRVRKQHAKWQKAAGRYEHWKGVSGKIIQICRPEVFTKENKKRLEGVWREKGKMILPTDEYREAREKFIERIGGEGVKIEECPEYQAAIEARDEYHDKEDILWGADERRDDYIDACDRLLERLEGKDEVRSL